MIRCFMSKLMKASMTENGKVWQSMLLELSKFHVFETRCCIIGSCHACLDYRDIKILIDNAMRKAHMIHYESAQTQHDSMVRIGPCVRPSFGIILANRETTYKRENVAVEPKRFQHRIILIWTKSLAWLNKASNDRQYQTHISMILLVIELWLYC